MSPGLLKITWKGLETPRLIGLTGAGFDNARENSKASVTPVEQRREVISREYSPLGARTLILVERSR